MDLSAAWERHVQNGIAWAREPGHDGFWEGTWPALRSTLPDPAGLTVDLGCGEGQDAPTRSAGLPSRRRRPIPVDAGSRRGRVAWCLRRTGGAAALPFGDRTISLVVSRMSLHDIDDFGAAISEVERDGLQMTFVSVHRSLSAYTAALARNGLVITDDPHGSRRPAGTTRQAALQRFGHDS